MITLINFVKFDESVNHGNKDLKYQVYVMTNENWNVILPYLIFLWACVSSRYVIVGTKTLVSYENVSLTEEKIFEGELMVVRFAHRQNAKFYDWSQNFQIWLPTKMFLLMLNGSFIVQIIVANVQFHSKKQGNVCVINYSLVESSVCI